MRNKLPSTTQKLSRFRINRILICENFHLKSKKVSGQGDPRVSADKLDLYKFDLFLRAPVCKECDRDNFYDSCN